MIADILFIVTNCALIWFCAKLLKDFPVNGERGAGVFKFLVKLLMAVASVATVGTFVFLILGWLK